MVLPSLLHITPTLSMPTLHPLPPSLPSTGTSTKVSDVIGLRGCHNDPGNFANNHTDITEESYSTVISTYTLQCYKTGICAKL